MKPFLLLQIRPETEAADNEYEAFVKFSGLDPNQLLSHNISNGDLPEINLDKYSGIILGGGPYNITDTDAKKTEAQKKVESGLLKLYDQIIERDFPFLASCFIGLLAQHQGGTVSRKYSEPVAAQMIKLTAAGKKDKLTQDLPDEFLAFAGHKEAVEALPNSATLLASSDTCPVHMYRIKQNIYATQFHSELDAQGLALRINVYKNHGYFPPEEADKLISMAMEQKVTEPKKILRRFIETYSQ